MGAVILDSFDASIGYGSESRRSLSSWPHFSTNPILLKPSIHYAYYRSCNKLEDTKCVKWRQSFDIPLGRVV